MMHGAYNVKLTKLSSMSEAGGAITVVSVESSSVHVDFVVEKVAVEQVLVKFFGFPPVSISHQY